MRDFYFVSTNVRNAADVLYKLQVKSRGKN